MEIAKFRNVGDLPLKLKHAQMGPVVLQPNEETILPLEYATLNVGHPNARDEGKNLYRSNSYKHLRRRWGFYAGMDPESEWDRMRPKVELYTLQGERMYHVLEDPEGTMVNPTEQVVGVPGSDVFLQAQVAAMQEQILALTALIASQQKQGEPTDDTPPSFDPLEAAVAAVVAQNESTAQAPDAVTSEVPQPKAGQPKTKTDAPRSTRVGGGS